MYKIAFVHSIFPLGGIEKVVLNLAPEMTKLGYKIYVLADDFRKDLMTEDDYKYVEVIEYEQCYCRKGNSESIISALRGINIDVIVFTTAADFNAKQEKYISSSLGCKYIHENHGQAFWQVHSRMESIKKKIGNRKFILSKYRYKSLLFLHNNSSYFRYRKAKSLYKAKINNSDKYVVLCQRYKEDILKKIKVNADKIAVISNGIAQPPIEYNLDKENLLLYVGRLSRDEKRVDRVLEVWNKIYRDFPEWRLQIVGEGDDRSRLEGIAKDLGIDRCEFCGSTSTPYKYYDKASILMLTSQNEGFGMVLIEAQQAGVVPIAFSCSAGVETILSPSWTNGVLVTPFDIDEYAQSLRKLMSDTELRKKLQANVIEKSKEYSLSNIAKQRDELIRSLFE